MTNYRKYLAQNLISLILVIPAFSQDEYYTNKHFGKKYVYTPFETELCIKFSKVADVSDLLAITDSIGLSLKTKGLNELSYGVFSLTKSISYKNIKERLFLPGSRCSKV